MAILGQPLFFHVLIDIAIFGNTRLSLQSWNNNSSLFQCIHYFSIHQFNSHLISAWCMPSIMLVMKPWTLPLSSLQSRNKPTGEHEITIILSWQCWPHPHFRCLSRNIWSVESSVNNGHVKFISSINKLHF